MSAHDMPAGSPDDGYSEPVAMIRRRARLLDEIEKLASENHPGEPADNVNQIRHLLAAYDTSNGTPSEGPEVGPVATPPPATVDDKTPDTSVDKTAAKPWWPGSGSDWKPGCPAWCVEHYDGTEGGSNHSSYPWALTGESANRSDVPVLVSAWIELRVEANGDQEAVGVIEKVREDVELSHCQLRDYARHLMAIADLVEEIERAKP